MPGDVASGSRSEGALPNRAAFRHTVDNIGNRSKGQQLAVEHSDSPDEDAENVAAQQTVERHMPPDRPGTEPPGLPAAIAAPQPGPPTRALRQPQPMWRMSRTPRRLPKRRPNGEDSGLIDTEEDDELDAADESDDQPDGPDKEEAPRSAWDAPGIADHPKKPETGEIRFTDGRRVHTLDGDDRGGGHRYKTGRPGKTEFPADWGDDTVVAHILDVARNPDTAEFQRRGTWKVCGERDGVEVNVAIKPDEQIWTAFPSPGGRGVIENPRED
jgi:hypothetical protein